MHGMDPHEEIAYWRERATREEVTSAALRAALVEALEIAARVVGDSQVLPSTDSARIAELRAKWLEGK